MISWVRSLAIATHMLATSYLDYCSVLDVWLPLQLAQTPADSTEHHSLGDAPYRAHTMPTLRDLYWAAF